MKGFELKIKIFLFVSALFSFFSYKGLPFEKEIIEIVVKKKEISWIENYTKWHNNTRQMFSNNELLLSPKRPNITVLFSCSNIGLNDRLKLIDVAFQQAYLEKHVLLYHWYTEPKISQFLQPNKIDWVLPKNFHNLTSTFCGRAGESLTKGKQVEIGNFFFRNVAYYDKRFGNLNEQQNLMKDIWNVLFKPSLILQNKLEKESQVLGLDRQKYDAVHCRVRHPAFYRITGVFTNNTEDRDGFNYTGEQKDLALQTANHGIKCVNWYTSLRNLTEFPIFFYSDTPELIQSMITNKGNFSNVSRVIGRTNTRAGHVGIMNAASAIENIYYDGFIDLFIASMARCVFLGIGGFAALAARISGSNCVIRHQDIPYKTMKIWGMNTKIEQCKV